MNVWVLLADKLTLSNKNFHLTEFLTIEGDDFLLGIKAACNEQWLGKFPLKWWVDISILSIFFPLMGFNINQSKPLSLLLQLLKAQVNGNFYYTELIYLQTKLIYLKIY